jgi:hypothetical protein
VGKGLENWVVKVFKNVYKNKDGNFQQINTVKPSLDS